MHCPELTWNFWKTQKPPPCIGLRQLSIPIVSDGQNYSVPGRTENYSYSSGFTITSCPPSFFQSYILYTRKWCYIYFSIWHLKTRRSPMVNKPSPQASKARVRTLVAAALPKEFVSNFQEARPQWLSLCHILSTGISLLSRPHDQVIQVIWTEAHAPYLEKETVPSALRADPAPVFLHSRLMTRDLAANTWSTAWTAPCSDVTPLVRGLRPSWKEPAIMYPQAGTVVM